MREISETHTFSKDEIEVMAKQTAKIKIIGGMYIGRFHGQTAEWLLDGSLRITTKHTPKAP